jgi:outer membrane protein assembly factor BamB
LNQKYFMQRRKAVSATGGFMNCIIKATIGSMLLLVLILTGTVLLAKPGFDWPQYRGLNRDGISKETGLIQSWPVEGPKVIWKVPVGDGYSAISVSNGRLFTMFSQQNDELVCSFDATTGKEIWRYKLDSNFVNDQGNGPRGTPTVDGDVVYVLGAQDMLAALNAKDGTKIWDHNLLKEMGGKVPIWGASSSPLVEKDTLIVPVGGSENNAVVCFNKKTGEVIWKSQSDEPGYSSPIAVTIGGVRQIIAFSGTALFSFSPSDGKMYWRYPWKTDWFVNAATPILVSEDKIFISTSYDRGSALLRVTSTGGKIGVEEVWLSKGMKNHFNSSVLHEGYLYGFDNAILKCIDTTTGEAKWQKTGYGKGSLIFADGNLIVLGERGQLLLVEATPEEYRQKATVEILQGKCWTEPTLSGGKLYLRNQKEMLCLDLSGKS